MSNTIVIAVGLMVMLLVGACREEVPRANPGEEIELPAPKSEGNMSLETALSSRRSVREYSAQPLSLQEVSQVLWAAQGVTSPRGYRTAPSAGATYPMELYLLASRVDGLSPGLYQYRPDEHNLRHVLSGDLSRALADASLSQSSISTAPANLIITAIYERTTKRYSQRGIRYVHMEAGHIGQNVCLQAEALRLGTVVIGAFGDESVQKVLQIKENPLYIIPLGKKR